MISKAMAERLNTQLKNEFFSAYSYLSMAGYCRAVNFNGAAAWMMLQYQEELQHAMKIFDYLSDQGAEIELQAMEQPAKSFSSILEVFEKALGHEQFITSELNALAGFALDEKDYATHAFLQWFLTEQIEEEATVGDIVEQLRLAGSDGPGWFLVDRELGARKPEPEA